MSEAIALAFEDREYTLAQLDALASGMATSLEHRGVRDRRPSRADVVEPAGVRHRPAGHLAAGCVGRPAQPGVEAGRGAPCTRADDPRARRRRSSGAGRGDADAAPRRADQAGAAPFRGAPSGFRRAVRVQLRHDGDAQGGASHARRVRGGRAALARRAPPVVGGSHADHDSAVTHPRPAQHRDGTGHRHLDPAAPPVRHRLDVAAHRKGPRSPSKWQ